MSSPKRVHVPSTAGQTIGMVPRQFHRFAKDFEKKKENVSNESPVSNLLPGTVPVTTGIYPFNDGPVLSFVNTRGKADRRKAHARRINTPYNKHSVFSL